MNARYLYMAAALATSLSLASMPAAAQERRGEGRDRSGARSAQGGGAGREARGSRAVPRPAEGRETSAVQQAPRNPSPRSVEGRRNQGSQTRARANGDVAYSSPRSRAGDVQAQPSVRAPRETADYGGAGPRAVPRSNAAYGAPQSRFDDRRGYQQYRGAYGRYDSRGYARPPHFQPYRPLCFSRPYYGFRPHVHIGFGVWLGVSVPYPWAYFGSYVPRVYGYDDRGYYGVAGGVQRYGGLSFDIQPSDADLYVDGEYVGAVGTFTPYGEPLTLWPGVHRIAIVRDGFRTMEWDVTVRPGEVIPYRGMLARW